MRVILELVAVVAVVASGPGCFLFRGGDGARCQPDRTAVLALQDDVAAFAGCHKASGLTIRTGATIDVTPLRELEEIGGDLVIGPTVGIDEVALNGLLHVGGTVRIASNGSLRGLFLPRLERAGRIEIDGNFSLTTISLPRLVTVPGAVVITDNHGLELVDGSALVSVGKELVISGHPKLNLIEMPHLAHADSIRLEGDPKLPPDVAEQLRAQIAAP